MMASLDVVSPIDHPTFPAGNFDNDDDGGGVVDDGRQATTVFSWKESSAFSFCFFLGYGANHVLTRGKLGCGGVGNGRYGKTVRTSEGNFESDVVFHQCGAPLARCSSCFLVPTAAGWGGVVVVDSLTSSSSLRPCHACHDLVSFLSSALLWHPYNFSPCSGCVPFEFSVQRHTIPFLHLHADGAPFPINPHCRSSFSHPSHPSSSPARPTPLP